MRKPTTLSDMDHWTNKYVAAVLIGMLSVALWLSNLPIFAVSALAVALISFLSTRQLIKRIEKMHHQKCSLDDQLIQAQKLDLIRELSLNIAHEINNPLAIISQEVEWARHLLGGMNCNNPEQGSELRDSLQAIGTQVDRCTDVTHRILDFARKKEPLIQKVDINRLVEDMARLVDREAQMKKIEIVRDYAQDLPSAYTDAPLLRQVVLNLLTNATYAIGKEGTIVITTRLSENNSIDILVKDTGCGIPKEHLGRIFEPFFTTKPQGKGTGLGLAICHGIVTRLDGHISVESEVGKGSVFTVHLPTRDDKGES